MDVINKDISAIQNAALNNYKGGKFLRGRKYSFSPHQKEKKNSSHNKGSHSKHTKKVKSKQIRIQSGNAQYKWGWGKEWV